VNEAGTEATAVSTFGIMPSSFPHFFGVDRPFIFYIYDRVNHLQLFVGRVIDPNGIAKLLPPSLFVKD